MVPRATRVIDTPIVARWAMKDGDGPIAVGKHRGRADVAMGVHQYPTPGPAGSLLLDRDGMRTRPLSTPFRLAASEVELPSGTVPIAITPVPGPEAAAAS